MTTESRNVENAEDARAANHFARCPDCGRPRIVTTRFVALREMPEYCMRDYAKRDDPTRQAACTPEDALQDCRGSTRPIDAIVWLLKRVASREGITWDARVSDQFGDDVTARLREWIRIHQVRPKGPQPHQSTDASRLELQQIGSRLGLVGTGWDSAEKIVELLDLLEVPRTPRNTSELPHLRKIL